MKMTENPGYQPDETKGKRVHVITRGGYDTRVREPGSASTKPGWDADRASWKLSPERSASRFADIIWYAPLT